MLSSIGISQDKPTMFYRDNQNAIWLVKNLEYHKRTKHIDTKYSFIREKWETKQIELSYVHTMTKLVICWLNHCPKISIKGYEAIWGWLLQNFHLLTWVSGRDELYAHRANDTHDVWMGVLSTHKKVCLSMNHSIGLERNGHMLCTWLFLFSWFMFLYLSSFLTMFKINLIVVTCRRKSNVV